MGPTILARIRNRKGFLVLTDMHFSLGQIVSTPCCGILTNVMMVTPSSSIAHRPSGKPVRPFQMYDKNVSHTCVNKMLSKMNFATYFREYMHAKFMEIYLPSGPATARQARAPDRK
jgi:hypothetical protein